jgi:hypothetical protein
MSRAKLFIVAVLGVLAFSAVASSMAEAGWMVNGTEFTSGTKALLLNAIVHEKGVLTAGAAEVKCEGSTLMGKNPVINGATSMGDATSLEFTECVGNAVCPIAASMEGKIGTLPVLADLTLDEPNTKAVKGVFLSTNSSKLFATIKFEGAECSLKGVQPVKGTQPFLAPTGRVENTLQLIIATNESSLFVGSTVATLKGSILVGLASGERFSWL